MHPLYTVKLTSGWTEAVTKSYMNDFEGPARPTPGSNLH